MMQTFQVNSHINEHGVLSVNLPKEWAEKDVNVVLVLEFLNKLKDAKPKKENLAAAFNLLAQMPDDFMLQREDDLPQEREEWL
jgi:virulence-associated protein VagC